MPLNKQIHLYALDTSSFYNDKEKNIGDRLNKFYLIRNKIKEKKNKNYKSLYNHQIQRINKIIKYYKSELVHQFELNIEIRNLREECLIDRNVVSIFESSLTRIIGAKPNELTEDLMIIQVYFFQIAEDLIKNGFFYKNEKYVLFSASAGQIRTKKFVMIKESTLKKHENTLMCGLNWDKINQKGGVNANKYLAYYALANSATDVWEEFDIDRAIVVDDFETLIDTVVDYIDDVTYKIERKEMNVPIPHTDGCGMKLHGKNLMCRLPWFKGLCAVFPFDELILEWRNKYNDCNIGVIKDIYGKEHDIIAENIEFIFTKSMFKMWKYYEDFDEYKYYFKKYNCEACKCNEEEDFIKDAKINYQMLQSLWDMKYSEMEKIASQTVSDIQNLGSDYRTMLRVLNVSENNPNQSFMQKSIAIYPELLRDKYNRQILKDCKVSLVKDGRAGRLSIDGKYTFVLPDLYAFCEWLFLGIEIPNGILKQNEVSCSLYSNDIELDCLRSPHLYKEHAIRTNKINNETKKWFKSKAIYTSTFDPISKILQFDCDGDKLLVVKDKTIVKVAKRNMIGIVPLYYDMKKADPQELNYENLFDGLIHAYTGGNIGIYSNNISKIHNSDVLGDEQLEVIKYLVMENNFVIDYAKTLYKCIRPDDKDELIKKYTKKLLPHFFIYAKDKVGYQVEDVNNSTMNMLMDIIPNAQLKINSTIGKVDLKMLMSGNYEISELIITDVINKYDYWNKKKNYMLRNKKKFPHKDKEYDNESYVFMKIRNDILLLHRSKDLIVDSLVYFLFNQRQSSDKKMLWECFGEEIYNNIKNNLSKYHNTKICPICGKRFLPIRNQLCCSSDCSAINTKEQNCIRKRKQRT